MRRGTEFVTGTGGVPQHCRACALSCLLTISHIGIFVQEKRIKGKILDDMQAEEALLDAYLKDTAAGVATNTAGDVQAGGRGRVEKFVIEGGLDLDDLEEDETLSSAEASGESVAEASGEEGEGSEARAGDGAASAGEIYMGPTGEGWETFKIEGELDLGLDDMEDMENLEPSDEWEAAGMQGGKEGGLSKWTGQTAFEFEGRQQRESKAVKQRKLQV